jgi:hypothetical protein
MPNPSLKINSSSNVNIVYSLLGLQHPKCNATSIVRQPLNVHPFTSDGQLCMGWLVKLLRQALVHKFYSIFLYSYYSYNSNVLVINGTTAHRTSF